MKCPVCQTTINDLEVICPVCAFDDLYHEFINVQDAQEWINKVVKPYQNEWLQHNNYHRTLPCYNSERAELLLRKYKKDEISRIELFELIALLYNSIISPTKKANKQEIKQQISLCIEVASKVKLNANSLVEHYRLLRLDFIKAILYLISGNLIRSYDLFSIIAKQIEMLSKKSDHAFLDASCIFFYSEANIHQIKLIASIEDENFYVIEKEEIKFHSRFSDFKFCEDGYLTLFNYLPIFSENPNPLYTVFDNNGKFLYSMGKNLRWLKIKRTDYDVCVSHPYWERKFENVDFEKLHMHIIKNPYKKINGYLHNIMECSNSNDS